MLIISNSISSIVIITVILIVIVIIIITITNMNITITVIISISSISVISCVISSSIIISTYISEFHLKQTERNIYMFQTHEAFGCLFPFGVVDTHIVEMVVKPVHESSRDITIRVYIYIYIYVYTYVCIHIYIYMCITLSISRVRLSESGAQNTST